MIPYSGEVYAYLLAGYRDAYLAIEIAACLAIAALLVAGGRAGRPVWRIGAVALAAIWLWLGVGFYWQSYEPLNWAGRYLGWAAILQAALVMIWGAVAGRFQPASRLATFRQWLATAVLVLSALAGPLVGLFSGGAVVALQAVGVTPLATMAATLALLLLNRSPGPLWLLPVPAFLLAWEAIRAGTLGLMQDGVLVAVAAVVLVLVAWPAEKSR
ncbi:MAG: DUF6064 family protein [Rhodospirillales bacterium]